MDKNKCFDSLSISASAGCGKTQEMASRLLGMFLSDIDNPEKIFNSSVAMTFSRSGAKEIYNRVLELIFDALLNNKIDSLNKSLQQLNFQVPTADRQSLINLLRKLIFMINDLKICTIDSFMAKIVTSFSTELGLPRRAELIGSGEGKILEANVLKSLLLSAENTQMQSENEMRDITMESKKNSYGKSTRIYHEDIRNSVQNCKRIVDDYPDTEAYQSNIDVKKLFCSKQLQTAWAELENIPTDPRYGTCTKRYNMLKKLYSAELDTFFNSEELKIMREYFDRWDKIKNREYKEIPKIKNTEFTENECNALQILLSYGACILLHQSCIRSEGALKLYRNYQKIYSDSFYSKGKLTFNDLPRLLSNSNNDWTYDIAYRLNNKFSHYLIDEFQDTSRMQWHILNSIFGTPDANDDKSLFIVGDIKQAIYGWRSGDRRLMGEVTELMKQQINLKEKPLDLSYRYGKNICTAINYLFDGESMYNAGFFPGTGEAWAKVFKEHNASDKLKYRSLFEAYLPDCSIEDTTEAYAQLILAKIKEYKIIAEQKSCAILVPFSSNGIELLDVLKNDPSYGKYFMWEGNKTIINDKIITALLHLLIYIQHPADTMAKAVAEMLPAIKTLIPRTREACIKENNILNQEGFYKYLKNCILKLQNYSESWIPDFKDNESIELFLRSADEFDRNSVNKDTMLFKKYIAEVAHSEEAVGYKIRIMTVHHSKGLTFDHVFYALFNHRKTCKINSREKNIPIAGKYSDNHTWMLNAANSEILVFPELAAAWDSFTVENIFEEFCTHYVALSRAKYTTTLILPKLDKNSDGKLTKRKTFNYDKFSGYMTNKLFISNFDVNEELFAGEYPFKSMKIDDISIQLPVAKPQNILQKKNFELTFKAQKSDSPHRRLIRPSDGTIENENNKQLFFNLPSPQEGKDFGIELHEFLCSVKDFSNFSFPAHTSHKVSKEVAKLLTNDEIKNLLNNFDKCFNELSFDVIIDDYYVSGCFDRVQLKYDADGKISHAVIIDYKSGKYDQTNSEKRTRYHNQLNLYRKALSQLLLLDIAKIECFIIATDMAFTEKVKP